MGTVEDVTKGIRYPREGDVTPAHSVDWVTFHYYMGKTEACFQKIKPYGHKFHHVDSLYANWAWEALENACRIDVDF